jgi:PIN domain nuclease of toxin-antitoxin system
MNVLLDTHAFLWFIEGSPRLSDSARELIRDPATELFMSVASLWEIAIKASIGRLPLLQPFEILIPDQLARHEISVIPIEVSHLVQCEARTPPRRSIRSVADRPSDRRTPAHRQRRSSV